MTTPDPRRADGRPAGSGWAGSRAGLTGAPASPSVLHMTTRRLTTWTSSDNRPAREALTAYAGEYAGDYDLDAAEHAYIAAINTHLPNGVTLALNGEVYGPVESGKPVDWASDLDIEAVAEAVDMQSILDANPRRS